MHPCGSDKGGCQHLCLPTSAATFACRCAIGYRADASDPKRCVGLKEFLFYSINWEIHGLPLDGDNGSQVLGPISRVSMASAVAFVANTDLLLWADSDHGTVTSIGRDGTKRKVGAIQFQECVELHGPWVV